VAVVWAEAEDAGGVSAESHVKCGNVGGENKISQQKKQNKDGPLILDLSFSLRSRKEDEERPA
jgi:hypothetical protein